MRNNTGDRILWLLTGLGIGAGAALLLAPKTGRDMRKYLHRFAEDSRDRIADGASDALDKGKEAIERGRTVIDDAMDFVERGRKSILRQS